MYLPTVLQNGQGSGPDPRIIQDGAQRRAVHQDVGVQHGEASVRVVAAGRCAVLVGALARDLEGELLGRRLRLDAAERAEPALQHQRRLVVDEQVLEAVGVDADAQRPILELRIDVALPRVGGLEHVAIGVDRQHVAHVVPPWRGRLR